MMVAVSDNAVVQLKLEANFGLRVCDTHRHYIRRGTDGRRDALEGHSHCHLSAS